MANELYREMAAFIDTKADWMRERRQDFHKHAEAGWHEVRTCSIIADHLVKLGYDKAPFKLMMGKECFDADARMGLPDQEELDMVYQRALDEGAIMPYAEKFKDGFTSVIAILETGKPGPVIGLRTDIDALGVVECQDPAIHRPAREGFASIHPGEMHACGHDGHATINMVVAETLMKYKDQLCGTVKMVWQPSEEGVRGARGIAYSGILDDVDYMIGVHMGARGKGDTDSQLEFCYDTSMANAKMDVYLHGKACHAAGPENGNNAMLAMAAIVQGIYGIPRASVGDSRINVGQVIAGSGRNVVCDRVKMVMELRGLTQAALDYMEPYARRIIEHGAAMHGCTAEIKMMGATPCVLMDSPEFTPDLKELCDSLGFKTLGIEPTSGSEDFSFMAERVQQHGGKSCFVMIQTNEPNPAHSVVFDIDEKDLPTGSKFLCAAVTYLMGLTVKE
ncbi:MAG: amidohydrolase [Firmicutes bacterium]|nr:amidohydrolase [Bacillota bacterium]